MMYLLVCFVSVATITVAYADSSKLEIQPRGPEVTREVGNTLALTCKPNVPDPEQVTQLEWRDPKNRPINNMNPEGPMYIQKLSSEPGSVLIFSKLAENLEGNYTCHASYAHTEPLKASIKVNTIVDITWIDAPESQYPILGSDYRIRCEVEAKPPANVDWNKGGVPILSEGRYITENKGLLIKNVQESDDGIYTCRAVVLSTGHMQVKNIKVEVHIPPKIEPIPPISIVEGEQASVQCKASSKPPSVYTWIRQGSQEDLSKKDRFDVKQNTGLLIINKAEFNDNAKYKCIAQNAAGTDEIDVDINVLVKPNIFELLNITAPIRNDTKIICKASGRPAPTVLFRKLSRQDKFQIGQQPDDSRVILEQKIDESKGETIGILHINSLNRSDDGLYQCIAENSVDAAYKNGHITVEFPPTFEKTKEYPPIWTWADKPGNLTCIAESIPNATIRWRFGAYEIGDQNPNMHIEGKGPISHLIVKPFNQKQFFARYECIASNKLGEDNTYIELREAKVPGVIQQVLVDSVTATTIKFKIVGPPNLTGLPLRTFIVQYQTERERTWDTARNKTWSVNAPYILEKLTPVETYNFRFAAANDVGIGGYGGGTMQYTMPMRSVPAEPKISPSNANQYDNNEVTRDVLSYSPYADHYELRWSAPDDNGDPIDSYIIRYCVTQKVNGEWKDSATECSSDIQQSAEYQSYELNGLLADTTYKIELRAHNAIGASTPAQIRLKTARGLDTMIVSQDEPRISSALIIGLVIGAVIIILIIVDIACFCVNRTGILAFICDCGRSKRVEEDSKLGSLYSWRFPLPYCSYKAAPAHPNSLNLPQPIKLAPSLEDEKEPLSPENRDQVQITNGERRDLTVEFDGRQVHTKPMEIGRYSAV